MVIEQVAILYTQIFAALLMGVSYFISKNKIIYYEDSIKLSLYRTEARLSKDINVISRSSSYIARYFIVSLIYLLFPILNINYHFIPVPLYTEHSYLWQIQLICTTTLCLIGFSRSIDVTKAVFIYYVLPSAFRLICVFLRKCEKGPLAAFGFLILQISFLMTYINIEAASAVMP